MRTLRWQGLRVLRFVTLGPVVLALAFVLRVGAPVMDRTQSARPVAQELARMPMRGSQLAAFNIRRDKFKDPRVRLAFNYAFDFEQMNKQIFFGQYTRIASYFEGTELASSGVPEGQELEILQTVRDQVPAEFYDRGCHEKARSPSIRCLSRWHR